MLRTISALALAACFTGAAAADTKQLNMGGSSTSSGFFPYYTAVAKAVSDDATDINVTLVSPGGFAKGLELLKKGELDFAGTSPALISEAAAEGIELRVLWWIYPAVQNIMVRADSGITSVSELDGKCFHPGKNGSSTQKNMLAILELLEVEPKLYLSDPKDAINAIKNGRCDGQVKSIGGSQLDGATAELNLSTPLMPIGFTADEQAKIKAALPHINFFEVDAEIVEGAEAYAAHTLWVGFAAPKEMDEDTAYKIVKGMMSGVEDQLSTLAALEGVDVPSRTLSASGDLLHAGAIKYFREIGLDVPEALIPSEAQ